MSVTIIFQFLVTGANPLPSFRLLLHAVLAAEFDV